MKFALDTLLTVCLLFFTRPVAAQSKSLISKQVFVQIERGYHGWDVEFDTDGQSIGGLSETELKTKFTKVKSAASVMNFMAQNGYKVTGFSSTQAGTGRGNGGGFNGYAILFEQHL